MAPPGDDRVRRGLALAQGAFLACSWTWCIGMFLPALLAADFGVPGWIIFAVPNVLGAMAMGLVLRQPGAAARLRAERPWAAAVFSSVTIAYHVFFLSWAAGAWLTLDPVLLTPEAPPLARAAARVVNALLSEPARTGPIAACMVFLFALGASLHGPRSWRAWAVVVWAVSIALVLGSAALLEPELRRLPDWSGASPPEGMLYALPALAVGFLLCPYLDLTFLRVRAETPGRTGSAAFVVGFGALFLAMIVLTLLYSGPIVRWLLVPRLVLLHMLVQSVFTLGAHLRELRLLGAPVGEEKIRPARPPGALVRLVLALAPLAFLPAPALLGSDTRCIEAYWLFLGCYGALFPALVWVGKERAMDSGAPRGVRTGVALLAALVAAPLYVGAFVHKEWWMAGPGALAILSAPLLTALVARLWRRPPEAPVRVADGAEIA